MPFCPTLVQERASGMYRLSAFYVGRTASDLPIDCAVPSLFIVIVYFTTGLRCNILAQDPDMTGVCKYAMALLMSRSSGTDARSEASSRIMPS